MATTKGKKKKESVEGLPPHKPWKYDMKKLIERSKKIRELEANESKYKYGEE